MEEENLKCSFDLGNGLVTFTHIFRLTVQQLLCLL